MPCPKGVDIPGNFYYYNLIYMEKKTGARIEFAQNMGLRKEPGFASPCINCGKCEQHCPQHLKIRDFLKQADKELRPFPYKVVINIARKFLLRDKKTKQGIKKLYFGGGLPAFTAKAEAETLANLPL